MAQGPSANPEKFSPPGPWGAAPDPRVGGPAADVTPTVEPPFLPSSTVVYALTLESSVVEPPFIASATVVHALDLTGSGSIQFDTSSSWVAPEGVYLIHVDVWGGGGGGAGGASDNFGHGGGGGGAYAGNPLVPVTPGNTYTVTVGAAGGTNSGGGTSTFVGDSSTTVQAVGGGGGSGTTAGAGGAAGSSTGTTTHSGGHGGSGLAGNHSGGSGGEAGGTSSDGNNGTDGTTLIGPAGASGGSDGGDGGRAGDGFAQPGFIGPAAGTAPGGGGGGSGSFDDHGQTGAAGAAGRVRISFVPHLFPPFIASATAVYTPTLTGPEVDLPFISSSTVVYAISALWQTSTGPGNGGETFAMQLAPNGSSVTATLAANVSSTGTSLELTGYGSLPASGAFCLTVDDEVLFVTPTSAGVYRIVARALSNTLAAAHTAGADATWTDSYDMAVESTNQIGSTVDYTIDGNTYDAWLIAFDSTQSYLTGDRYAVFVDELVGVFPPGTGSAGTNRLDAAQPTAEHAPAGVTDDCPVGITVPARLASDIEVGDVALCRYVNPEASILVLGPRSTAIQSWYGFMRVDPTNVDVTATDPTATVVDAGVDDEFFNEDFVTVTLPGTDRTFTYGPPHYSDKGWPIAALAIRQGTKRVPLWTSPDWHNFAYVYTGFGVDATYVQVLINRNGFDPLHPEFGVSLPGPQDIDGPNATWDDPAYYTSVAWYVGIFKSSVLLAGPPLNPPPPSELPPPPPGGGILPVVPPGPGGGGTVDPPPDVPPEGGSGGNISPPTAITAERFWVTLV